MKANGLHFLSLNVGEEEKATHYFWLHPLFLSFVRNPNPVERLFLPPKKAGQTPVSNVKSDTLVKKVKK